MVRIHDLYDSLHREQEAETLLRGDPFHAGGVFVTWVMRPWNPVMANPTLFPAG